jgi:hypothetical protein
MFAMEWEAHLLAGRERQQRYLDEAARYRLARQAARPPALHSVLGTSKGGVTRWVGAAARTLFGRVAVLSSGRSGQGPGYCVTHAPATESVAG